MILSFPNKKFCRTNKNFLLVKKIENKSKKNCLLLPELLQEMKKGHTVGTKGQKGSSDSNQENSKTGQAGKSNITNQLQSITENNPKIHLDQQDFFTKMTQIEKKFDKTIKEKANVNEYFNKLFHSPIFTNGVDLNCPFLCVRKSTCKVTLEIFGGQLPIPRSKSNLIELGQQMNNELTRLELNSAKYFPNPTKRRLSAKSKNQLKCPTLMSNLLSIEKSMEVIEHSSFRDIYGSKVGTLAKEKKMIENGLNAQVQTYMEKKLVSYEEDRVKQARKLKKMELFRIQEDNAEKSRLEAEGERKLDLAKGEKMRRIEESKVRRNADKEMLDAWSKKEFPNLKSKPLHVSLERKSMIKRIEYEATVLAALKARTQKIDYEKLTLHQKQIGDMIEKRKSESQ